MGLGIVVDELSLAHWNEQNRDGTIGKEQTIQMKAFILKRETNN